jgi:adenylate/guanylate cyclase family protein
MVNRDTDLSDFVEIGFTVSKAVRTSRFHDPENLSAKERYVDYNISASAIARDGTKARDFYWRHHVFCTYVEPGESRTFQVNLEPGFFSLRYGPEFIVDPSSDNRVERIGITHLDGRPAEPTQTVGPGSLTYNLTNAAPTRIIAFAISITAAERRAYSGTPPGFRLGGFLSGSRLLSTQTFLDLFPSETVMSAGGLAVKRVALLFTDIKGSTALYDRIGDMKAFNLVRQHFGVLRDAIAANHGALVKTIGDAVMASFHEPLDAIRAALDMLAQIRRFNDSVGEELITLKIGAHVGQCLAVTLNERLDYFGQTANLGGPWGTSNGLRVRVMTRPPTEAASHRSWGVIRHSLPQPLVSSNINSSCNRRFRRKLCSVHAKIPSPCPRQPPVPRRKPYRRGYLRQPGRGSRSGRPWAAPLRHDGYRYPKSGHCCRQIRTLGVDLGQYPFLTVLIDPPHLRLQEEPREPMVPARHYVPGRPGCAQGRCRRYGDGARSRRDACG